MTAKKRPPATSFELGDRALATSIKQVMAETGYQRRVVTNAVRVARAFSPERRHERLSWPHHADTVTLSQADQDKWLTKAEEEHWSGATLRAKLREAGLRSPSHRARGSLAVDNDEAFEIYVSLGPKRTLKKVAEHFGVTPHTIENYARGRHNAANKTPWHERLAERDRKNAELAENEDLRERAKRRKQLRQVLEQSGSEILRRIEKRDPEQPLSLQGLAALAKVVAAQEGEATERVDVHHLVQVLPQLVTDVIVFSIDFVPVERHDEFLAGADEIRARYGDVLELAARNGDDADGGE